MNIATLPDNLHELKALFFDQKERYELRIEYLEERVRLLTNELFRRSSEKRPQPDDPRQLHLFNEAEALSSQEKMEPVVVVPEHTRQKPKRKPLPDHLPRIEVIHDIDESEKMCACGTELSRIGEEVTEKLDIVPATVQVLRHIRPKYACKGCEGVESEGATVKIAEAPLELIPKGMATAGTVAYVATAKYVDATPLYRLEKILARHGIEKTAREGGLSPDETKALREEKAVPILEEFKAWMEKRLPQTPPEGLLGKALSYALNHWTKLIRYLEDGRIPIDNNWAENAIRPFVIGRKNWLFSGHPNGAHAAATLYSLIETAKSCGLEAYHYLRYLFEKIPLAKSEEDHQALLPQRLTPEQLRQSVL